MFFEICLEILPAQLERNLKPLDCGIAKEIACVDRISRQAHGRGHPGLALRKPSWPLAPRLRADELRQRQQAVSLVLDQIEGGFGILGVFDVEIEIGQRLGG